METIKKNVVLHKFATLMLLMLSCLSCNVRALLRERPDEINMWDDFDENFVSKLVRESNKLVHEYMFVTIGAVPLFIAVPYAVFLLLTISYFIRIGWIGCRRPNSSCRLPV